VSGQVAGADAVAVLDMDLAAGDDVSLRLKAGAKGYAPDIVVLAPPGATVASASDKARAKLALRADETGVYQIRLTSNDNTAPRFTLKVRGDESRKYTDRSGAFEFGVRAGSRITVKVRAKSAAGLQLYDSAGDDLDASYTGSGKSRKAVVYAASENDAYSIVFSGRKAKAKVKVTYPAPRGRQALTMTPAPVAAPAAPQQPQPQPQAPQAGNTGTQNNANGNPAGTAGNAGNAGNAGAAPAPAPIADHVYLMVLLAEKARIELKNDAHQPGNMMRDALEAACGDAIVADIQRVLDTIERPLGERGVDAIIDLIAAQRRADRAREALDILARDISASTLAADVAYAAGQAQVEGELSRLDNAISFSLHRGLEYAIRGRTDPRAPSFDAPAAPAAANEVILALAALDAAVLSGPIMSRARADQGAEIALAETLYATYETLLNANPAADANAAATLNAIRQARAELAARSEADFEIALASRPIPDANQPCEMEIVALGAADAEQVEYQMVGNDDAMMERTESGVRIHLPTLETELNLQVTARYAGAERTLHIHVELAMPEVGNLRGRVVDGNGNGRSNTHYEILNPADRSNPMAIGETDDDGNFEIDQVPVGEWILVIVAEGHEPMEMLVNVESRQDDDPQDAHEIVID